MKTTLLLLIAFLFVSNSKAQINADSMYIFYGMTQSAPTEPLMDYIEQLETSGAKSIKIKTTEYIKIKDAFTKTKAKKYKGEKHKGTVYFVILFTGDKKEFGAFDSTTEEGKFINLSSKQIYKIDDKAMSDKLYYALLAIH